MFVVLNDSRCLAARPGLVRRKDGSNLFAGALRPISPIAVPSTEVSGWKISSCQFSCIQETQHRKTLVILWSSLFFATVDQPHEI